jgi:hypothetical protein
MLASNVELLEMRQPLLTPQSGVMEHVSFVPGHVRRGMIEYEALHDDKSSKSLPQAATITQCTNDEFLQRANAAKLDLEQLESLVNNLNILVDASQGRSECLLPLVFFLFCWVGERMIDGGCVSAPSSREFYLE